MQHQTDEMGKQYFIPVDSIRRYVDDVVLSENLLSDQ